MNRGFKTYFKEGLSKSFKIFKKKGNYLRYYLYWTASLLGKSIPIISSIFMLSDVRMTRLAKNHEQILVANSFEATDEKGSILTMIFSFIIQFLLFISGILFIGLIAGAVLLFVASIENNVSTDGVSYLLFLPVVILLIGYLVIYPLMFVPTAYIVDTNPTIGVSTLLFNSIDSMKRTGKWTYCLINIVSFIPGILVLLVSSIITIILINIGGEAFVIGALLVFVFLAAFLMVAPIFDMAGKIATVLLFEDIVLDDFNRTKNISGITSVSGNTGFNTHLL